MMMMMMMMMMRPTHHGVEVLADREVAHEGADPQHLGPALRRQVESLLMGSKANTQGQGSSSMRGQRCENP
jgi:hypothetical protein